jgi:hypothetical protein
VRNQKARAMQYALSALKRWESVALAGLIEDEIDLTHVLPVALLNGSQKITRDPAPERSTTLPVWASLSPVTGSGVLWVSLAEREGWSWNGVLGQISGSERGANLMQIIETTYGYKKTT